MGNTRKPLRIVSIKLPSDLDDQLTALAAVRGVTRSWVLREALTVYAASPQRSVTQAAGALVGSIKGPRDLSTAAKHMRRYGQ